jgi:hypothetical protein
VAKRDQRPSNYALKVDDLLLKLLKDYHEHDASDVMSFFGERAEEMLVSEPNITEKSRSPVTHFIEGKTNKTVSFSHKQNKQKKAVKFGTMLQPMEIGRNRVYVLRGFYPNSNIPFKMTLVKFHDYPIARGKVKIGMKEHYTLFNEFDISTYNEMVSEAILLETKVSEENKIDYEYRKFKCMRPRGMELYHERKDGEST